MLGKLIKYDFKAIFKFFIPMSIFILVYSCIGTLLFRFDDADSYANSKQGEYIIMLVIGIYILTCFAYFIITQGIIVVNFYKSMVTDTGYLTHTLPVKKSTLLTAKMISGFVTMLLTYMIFFICLVIMLDIPTIFIEHQNEIFDAISQAIGEVGSGIFVRGIISILFLAMVGIIQSLSMFFLAIALGQLMNRHKVVGSLVSYFAIALVFQIAFSILSVNVTTNIDSVVTDVFKLLSNIFSSMSVAMLFVSAGMLLLTHYIFKRKLNLD